MESGQNETTGLHTVVEPKADGLLSNRLQLQEFSFAEGKESVHIVRCFNGIIMYVYK